MAFIDMLGIASIMPFIALLTNPEIINTNEILNFAYKKGSAFGINNEQDFLIFVGIIVFCLLIASIVIKALTTFFQSKYIRYCEFSLSKRLFKLYLYQPYSWFLNQNSSYIGKTILSETGNVISRGLNPFISLISNIIILFTLFAMLLYVDTVLTLLMATTIGLFYLIVYSLMRKLLNKIGEKNFKNNELKFRTLLEAFSATKEVKVGGLEQIFINRYSQPARSMAYNTALSDILSQLPRFVLEAISFGGLILVIIFYMLATNNITSVLPIIALYAFAGYRLMPAIQKIFVSFTQLRISGPAIISLYNDLKKLNLKIDKNYNNEFFFNESIKLKDISYAYPKSSRTALKNINLTIPAHTTVGVVGETGSGKTTVIDIILGLLEAQEGVLQVDGKIINYENKRAWQNMIGYVPQQIYLADTTVSENIAFGLKSDEINHENVERAAKIANLHEFIINELPSQYQTTIGERGVRLSGGQRQRIGIARALYNEPKLLIFDEATSALDNTTERSVMEAIYNEDYKTTKILIAHRLSTVKKCDKIFLFDKGELKNEGNYQDLLKNSEKFRLSAKNS
ncbi:ABC transporter ATP-binding protein/permease [Candidatus Pelagibacter sp.]|nr:ABC transporter ATP-binding protein/permease [Candidatus Pelagibacter sp.]